MHYSARLDCSYDGTNNGWLCVVDHPRKGLGKEGYFRFMLRHVFFMQLSYVPVPTPPARPRSPHKSASPLAPPQNPHVSQHLFLPAFLHPFPSLRASVRHVRFTCPPSTANLHFPYLAGACMAKVCFCIICNTHAFTHAMVDWFDWPMEPSGLGATVYKRFRRCEKGGRHFFVGASYLSS